jgi:hypothetical protein
MLSGACHRKQASYGNVLPPPRHRIVVQTHNKIVRNAHFFLRGNTSLRGSSAKARNGHNDSLHPAVGVQHPYMDKLNEEQKAASTCISPQIIVKAGPGSGKTTVVAARVVWLLHCGARPQSILAVTFTNKVHSIWHHKRSLCVKSSKVYHTLASFDHGHFHPFVTSWCAPSLASFSPKCLCRHLLS